MDILVDIFLHIYTILLDIKGKPCMILVFYFMF